MGDAPGSGNQVLGRRYADARARRHADPLRRPFCRRHGAALGTRRRRPRRATLRRHRAGHSRPQVCHLHAQLSEYDPAVGAGGRTHRRDARAVSPSTSSTAPGSTAPSRTAARTSSAARSPVTWPPCEATARPNCIEPKETTCPVSPLRSNRAQLNARQQALHDDFLRSRPRKTLTGPFAVLIDTPDIAEPCRQTGELLPANTKTRPPADRTDHPAGSARRDRSVCLVGARADRGERGNYAGHDRRHPCAAAAGFQARRRAHDLRFRHRTARQQNRQHGNLRARQGGVRTRRRHRGRHLHRPLRHDRTGAQRVRDSAAAGKTAAC